MENTLGSGLSLGPQGVEKAAARTDVMFSRWAFVLVSTIQKLYSHSMGYTLRMFCLIFCGAPASRLHRFGGNGHVQASSAFWWRPSPLPPSSPQKRRRRPRSQPMAPSLLHPVQTSRTRIGTMSVQIATNLTSSTGGNGRFAPEEPCRWRKRQRSSPSFLFVTHQQRRFSRRRPVAHPLHRLRR